MDSYDPAPLFIGQPTTHVVEVTIQQWQYTRTFEVETPGNSQGWRVLEDAIENIYEGLPSDERDPTGRFAVVSLTDPNGETLLCEEADATAHPDKEGAVIMSGLDWLKEMVVAVRIKEVRIEEVPRPIIR